jgi:enamine deaminase RidA (YjgF/YER057c/UK114 family)
MTSFFNPPNIWQPFGAFSMAAAVGAGQVVHLKGQVALDADGTPVSHGDMRAQLRKVLENIDATLAHVGGTMTDIFSLTQYVTDIEAFMAAGEVRLEFFSAPYPVTTTIQVSRLYHRDLLVEITAIAEVPLDRFHPAD